MNNRNIQDDPLVKIARDILEGNTPEQVKTPKENLDESEFMLPHINGLIELAKVTLGGSATQTEIHQLAAVYGILIYGGVTSVIAALGYGVRNAAKDYIVKPIKNIWNAIDGRFLLKPDELEAVANDTKTLLTGNDKGKITRLTNIMKVALEDGKWAKASTAAKELHTLIKK
jgi:hypothetical protein